MLGSLMSRMKVGGAIIGGVVLLIAVLAGLFCVGHNNYENWQVYQSLNGQVRIIDNPGWYFKPFATVWTWPRAMQKYLSAVDGEGDDNVDESVRVTFNDGGTADMSFFIRCQTPNNEVQRRRLQQDFSGNPDNMLNAVRAHLINCAKAAAPLMSASEHQSARKAEYTQIVNDQLNAGLYEMKKVSLELKDRVDEKGKPIIVYATEIVRDENGHPIIAQASPLNEYGIVVLQFSVTETDYDEQTLKQFEAKKDSFLGAEKSKAQREQEVQLRLMTVEKGLREKAEVEAVANKELAAATIAADQVKQVAEIEAKQKTEVAKQATLQQEAIKQKMLVEASQKMEVAEIDLTAARLQAEAIKTLAEAKQKEIQLAGKITEREQTLAQLQKETVIGVAAEYAKVNVPEFIVAGGDGSNGGADPMALFGINMLQNIRKNDVANKADMSFSLPPAPAEPTK